MLNLEVTVMKSTVVDYYLDIPDQMHFAFIPEKSMEGFRCYRMLTEYGEGSFKLICFNKLFLILVADFTPLQTFEKISEISQHYIEISQFETDTSSFKVGKRKLKQVEQGILCYANTSRTVYAYCEANKPARFTKIILTQDYFEKFINERYGDTYHKSLNSFDYLTKNPNSPELNFILQQIRDCTAVGTALQIYLESKVLETLSMVTNHFNQVQRNTHLPVKLDKKDRRFLAKTVTYMKKDLSAYPTVKELAIVASMSESRYQLAFKQVYGTTVYEYLKALRMNNALLLLKDSDYDIRTIAEQVGYTNAGHFAGLFRKLYGVTPKEYRLIHGIK